MALPPGITTSIYSPTGYSTLDGTPVPDPTQASSQPATSHMQVAYDNTGAFATQPPANNASWQPPPGSYPGYPGSVPFGSVSTPTTAIPGMDQYSAAVSQQVALLQQIQAGMQPGSPQYNNIQGQIQATQAGQQQLQSGQNGISLPNQYLGPTSPNAAFQNPTYDSSVGAGGWNPQEYASNDTTQSLASMLGGTPQTLTSGGPFGNPPQNFIGGLATGSQNQDLLNAGLLAQRYASEDPTQANAQTLAELNYKPGVVYGQNAGQPAPGATPPPSIFGSSGGLGNPGTPNPPGTTSQGTNTAPPGNPGMTGTGGTGTGTGTGIGGSSGQPFGNTFGQPSGTGGSANGSGSSPLSFSTPNYTSSNPGGSNPLGSMGASPLFGAAPNTGPGLTGSTASQSFGMPTLSNGGTSAFPTGNNSVSQYLANLANQMKPLQNFQAYQGSPLTPITAPTYNGSALTGFNPYALTAPSNVTPNLSASNADADYQRQLVQSGGSPVDQTAAWQAMVAAEQRNNQEAQANTAEQYNVSGNRFSSTFGNAMTDLVSQQTKDQNANLTAAQAQALENAANRQYSGAQNLTQSTYQNQQFNTSADLQAQQANQNAGLQMNSLGLQGSAQSLQSLMQQSQMQQAYAQMGLTAQQANQQGQISQNQLGMTGSGQNLSAAQQLAQYAYQGPSQLAQQQFQSGMQSQQLNQSSAAQQLALMGQYGLAQQQGGIQGALQGQNLTYNSDQLAQQQALQAAMSAGGASSTAAQMLAQMGAAGAQGLSSNAMSGAGSLFGAENTAAQNLFNGSNTAANNMYSAQNTMLPQMMQYLESLNSQGTTAASNLSQLWNNSLNTGSQLGSQQMNVSDFNLNQVYNEWLRTQPDYNPLLPYLYGAATAQPAMYTPSFQPSTFSQIAGGVGSILGGAGALAAGL